MTAAAEVVSKNLGQRIQAVMRQVEYIKKAKTVGKGEYAYKAVTHDEVTGILREHLIECGIRVVPRIVSGTAKSVPISKGGKPADSSGWIRFEADFEVDLVNVDDSADRETYSTAAHADDNGDKAPGKALSYAVKAVLLKAFSIETGVNDESRYGSSTERMTAEAVAEGINHIADAKTTREVRDRYDALLDLAGEDEKTAEMFREAANKRRESLKSVKQPTEKATPKAEPNDGPIETVSTVAPADSVDDDEPRASAGLVKSIRNLIDTKGLADTAVKKITKGKALEAMSKSEAARVLATVSAS